MLAKFWLRMGAMFGHTWSSQYGVSPEGDAADTWSAALSGLTGEHLAVGLREVVKLGGEWPPSAPRFRALCFNIPALAFVRQDLRPNNDGHRQPFTRLVWSYLDVYAFTRADQEKADRMLREAYQLAHEHRMIGGALPEEVNYLEQAASEPPVYATPAEAKKHLGEIAKIFEKPKTDEEAP